MSAVINEGNGGCTANVLQGGLEIGVVQRRRWSCIEERTELCKEEEDEKDDYNKLFRIAARRSAACWNCNVEEG
jgi:hypothetical protein